MQHPHPKRPQYSPHDHHPYQIGKTRHLTPVPDISSILPQEKIKWVQSALGSLLYYAQAIDGTILPALSSIATQQAKPTDNTLRKVKRLLDHVATYPNVFLQYYASNMLLHIDSDAAYLVA